MPAHRKGLRYWLVGRVASVLVRLLMSTWRVEVDDPAARVSAVRRGSAQAIAAFWHRHILSLLPRFRGFPVCVPVSQSRDGEYVARVMDRFGLASVRGSSSRGGIGLLKGLLRAVDEGYSPAITPDGPRGPRYSVQPGFTLLARRTGLPVFPLGVAVEDAWVLSSWDAFVIPKPGTRVVICVGEGLHAADYEDTEEFCRALRNALFAATERARVRLENAGR
jgi:hypothetical protein